MAAIDTKYFNFQHQDKIFNTKEIEHDKIHLNYLGVINSDKGYDYDFYFVKHDDDYINISIPKKEIMKSSTTEDLWMYWNLRKGNHDLLSTFSKLDDYFENYNDEKVNGKHYVPVLRENKNEFPYIKVRLFRKLPDDVLMTKVYIKDFYSDKMEEKTIESFEEFEQYYKQAKEVVVFPSKLWITNEDYGITLRIKYLIIE